ncbi:FKBP-type peptidyl-prolyl cis-trans isomerase [Leyella stercorea]|jgi:FKBP-type peptidyl-prolyl cis-trans isomerase FklB|uniref:FKBP-type peptidyl-prolyl cis-trans isomerase n=1 Tax=Leyella stercorea TaxID=363265 RepID=UPI00242D07D1|nr:FKBP-type peptidyl-prolyl cis-trans isomerase [Leyella stercorea]
MKKILTLALVAALSATFTTASAKDKKECCKAKTECCKVDKKKNKKCKKDKTSCCEAPVSLLSKSDSLSYAAGMTYTTGLIDYVGKQFGVDSTSMGAFVAGLREGIKRSNDKQFMAHSAGVQIAQLLETRMYPGVANEVKNTPWTLDSITFNRGFIDAVLNDTTVMQVVDAKKYYEKTMTDEKHRQEDAYKKENVDWLAENAKKEGVVTLPSGLQYKVLTAGTGEVATKDDNVTVRYEGKTIDGNIFDSSYKRNPDTSTFRPDQVIKGWTEALTSMPAGSTWMLYIPQELAYGSRAAGQIKPYSTLIFKVELVKIDRKQPVVEEKKEEKAPAKKTTAKKSRKK